jgi:hypothetical protein
MTLNLCFLLLSLELHNRDFYVKKFYLKDWEVNRDNIELLCANCHRLHNWETQYFGPWGAGGSLNE